MLKAERASARQDVTAQSGLARRVARAALTTRRADATPFTTRALFCTFGAISYLS